MKARYPLTIIIIALTSLLVGCSKKQSTNKSAQSEPNQSLQAPAEKSDVNSDDLRLKRAVEKTLESKQSERRPR